MSWDCAFKDLDSSDFVVGQVWARAGSWYLMGDQVRAKMDYHGAVNAVRRVSERWPKTITKLIEDEASGSAVIQLLEGEIPESSRLRKEAKWRVRSLYRRWFRLATCSCRIRTGRLG